MKWFLNVCRLFLRRDHNVGCAIGADVWPVRILRVGH